MALGGNGVAVVTAPVGGALNDVGAGVNQALSPLGPVGAIAAAPLDVAGNVTTGVGTALGGPVVGVVPSVAPRGPLIGAGLLPADRQNMDRLTSLDGRQFEALYRATQEDSLRQLAVLYRDYAASGDDPALRALAANELPKVDRLLKEVGRL